MSTLVQDRGESPTLGKSMKRSNKPQMEKRRRERINTSLNQLKSLVLDALKKDTSQYSKLEKADILEMTVRHLRGSQRQHLAVAASTDASVMGKFRMGYTECASEVARYLSTVDGLSPEVRNRLLQHLSGNCQRIGMAPEMPVTSQPTQPIRIQIPMATQASALPGATVQTLVAAPANQMAQPIQHVSPIAAQTPPQYVGSFQVIPNASLTSPEMAVVMPSSVATTSAGLFGNVTPLYLNTQVSSPPQALQLSSAQLSSVQLSLGRMQVAASVPATTPVLRANPRPQAAPQPSYHKDAILMSPKQHLAAVDIPAAMPTGKGVMLREEKVWRPW